METAHYPGKRYRAPASVAALLALALAGCGGPAPATRPARPVARIALPSVWPAVPPERPDAANAVLMRAISLVGTPYRYGGNTPEGGFDCSGLVGYVFRDMLDRPLPRSSSELARTGEPVGPMRMAGGDLVVFGDGSIVSHVGIYVGEGRFVHAPSTGGTVRLDRADGPYWAVRFAGARRILR
ncbi:C40 family peptidase [Lysobacter xanthus]